LRKFDPLKADHPVIGKPCPVCEEVFKEADEIALIATYPADRDEARKAREGKAYNSRAEIVHWDCRSVP